MIEFIIRSTSSTNKENPNASHTIPKKIANKVTFTHFTKAEAYKPIPKLTTQKGSHPQFSLAWFEICITNTYHIFTRASKIRDHPSNSLKNEHDICKFPLARNCLNPPKTTRTQQQRVLLNLIVSSWR